MSTSWNTRLQILRSLQIALDHRRPALALLPRRAGKAVARQIHKEEFLVEQIEVHQSGLARLRRRARQLGIVGEAVNQRRLAHVGFAREGNLRQALSRKGLQLRQRGHEFRFLDRHTASLMSSLRFSTRSSASSTSEIRRMFSSPRTLSSSFSRSRSFSAGSISSVIPMR